MNSFDVFADKMRKAHLSEAAIKTFARSYKKLKSNESGMIPEDEISPVKSIPSWQDILSHTPPANQTLIAQAVCIKLNGGLGTSMGLKKAKSLLKIKKEDTFLDIIIQQIKYLRQQADFPVRLLLMNSFSTSSDTLAYLSKYSADGLNKPGEVELMQNMVPKILESSLLPAEYPQDPQLEWCPPGHGDLYPALSGSGWLDTLLKSGVKYAFISNSDNLGAQLDLKFLNWFSQSGIPFIMEVTKRTEADKKGGHLAIRNRDNQLILREIAQCPEKDTPQFQNIAKHQYFNTNNLWIRLDALKEILESNDGVLPIPVITNKKTLDPRNPDSPSVYQLETAMGAGIECFAGASAVDVPRTRFFPVKTCSDLFLLRSDAICINKNTGEVTLNPALNGNVPIVDLDPELYKFVDSLDELGMPSLLNVQKLFVRGRHHFKPTALLSGEVILENSGNNIVSVE